MLALMKKKAFVFSCISHVSSINEYISVNIRMHEQFMSYRICHVSIFSI